MSMLKGGEKFTIMSEIRMENVQWGKGWGGVKGGDWICQVYN